MNSFTYYDQSFLPSKFDSFFAKEIVPTPMNAFTYYFDPRFIPSDFDSFFSKPIEPEKKQEVKEVISKKTKYVPQVMEASSLEFKKSKYNNRKTAKKKK